MIYVGRILAIIFQLVCVSEVCIARLATLDLSISHIIRGGLEKC